MADVRSMLRQERAARQKPSAAPAPAPISKKRKATDDGVEERKRTRTEETTGVPAGFFDGGANAADEVADSSQPGAQKELQDDELHTSDGPSTSTTHAAPATNTDPAPAPLAAADEADLDAFLKEMEQPRPPPPSGAVIESAPMTAAELAAQAREDQSAQRSRREAELEADKEDAARQLEEEFDQMESYEERVRKLREKREALRIARTAGVKDLVVAKPPPAAEDDESDISDEDDFDDWAFRRA